MPLLLSAIPCSVRELALVVKSLKMPLTITMRPKAWIDGLTWMGGLERKPFPTLKRSAATLKMQTSCSTSLLEQNRLNINDKDTDDRDFYGEALPPHQPLSKTAVNFFQMGENPISIRKKFVDSVPIIRLCFPQDDRFFKLR